MLPSRRGCEEAHIRCSWSNLAQELESLLPDLHPRVHDDAGHIATGAREALGQTGRNWVIHHRDDWDRVGHLFEQSNDVSCERHDQVGRLIHNVLCKFPHTIRGNPLARVPINGQVGSFYVAKAPQFGEECLDRTASCLRQHGDRDRRMCNRNSMDFGVLLPACRKWPGCRRTNERHELPPRQHHSMTSSARASNVGGMVRPSAFAVLRLMISSYLDGASIGRSAGFSPLRMRSTYPAARRYWST